MNFPGRIIFMLFIAFYVPGKAVAQIYMTYTGTATFASEAPLEFISASSENLQGAVSLSDNRFVFKIENKSFTGFNSALQQEHFYENYIETDKYKSSTFQGKIIGKIDLRQEGPQEIRAKGVLSIHGVARERIIRATITVAGGELVVHSEFDVALEDHDIRVPNVVYQKIADIISVRIDAVLKEKTN